MILNYNKEKNGVAVAFSRSQTVLYKAVGDEAAKRYWWTSLEDFSRNIRNNPVALLGKDGVMIPQFTTLDMEGPEGPFIPSLIESAADLWAVIKPASVAIVGASTVELGKNSILSVEVTQAGGEVIPSPKYGNIVFSSEPSTSGFVTPTGLIKATQTAGTINVTAKYTLGTVSVEATLAVTVGEAAPVEPETHTEPEGEVGAHRASAPVVETLRASAPVIEEPVAEEAPVEKKKTSKSK